MFSITSIKAQDACCCGPDADVEVPGGDFEFSPYPPPGGWLNYTGGFGPWEVTSGSVSHHDDGHNNLGDGNPNPSTAHLDINGSTQGAFCQTLSGFEIGQECTLTFFYAMHSFLNEAEATVEIDGGAALSETWEADNPGNDEWLEANYTFVATDTEMELCFISETSMGCCGMLLDDISLSCCPADQEDPVLDPIPEDMIISCINDLPEEPELDATDDCSDDIDIEFSEDIEEDDCNYIVYRNWTVMDNCGKIIEHEQVITVVDDEAPELLDPPMDLEIFCDENTEELFADWIDNMGFANIDENCDEVLLEVEHDEIPFGECGETRVTFIYSDLCGNSVEEEAYFEIEDRFDPLFTSLPQNLNVSCDTATVQSIDNWIALNGGAEGSDDCAYSISSNFNGNYQSDQEVIFTITDNCGNANEASAWIFHDVMIDTIVIDSFTCDPSSTGTIEEFIDSSDGCDSLVITNIILLESDTIYLTEYECGINTVDSDSLLLTNMNGCDSLVIVTTIGLETDTTYVMSSSCDSLQTGIDTLFLFNADNCDSLVITETQFLNSVSTSIFETSCDPTLIDQDTLEFIGSNGCDSIVYIEVAYTPIDTIQLLEYSCLIDSEIYDTLNIPGELCDTVQITQFIPLDNDTTYLNETDCSINTPQFVTEVYAGSVCDSIVITEIIPIQGDTVTVEEVTCRLVEIGTDTIILMNGVGCDSMIITNTIYEAIDPTFIALTTCDEDMVIQDTSYVTGAACDSTIITSYTLLPSSESFLQETACQAQENDTLLLSNSLGCDSIVITSYEHIPVSFELNIDYDPCLGSEDIMILFENYDDGSGPYEFIVGGQSYNNSQVISLLDSGTYEAYIIDSNGCESEVQQFEIDIFEGFEINAPDTLFMSVNEDGLLSIDINPIPVNIDWVPDKGLSCTDCLDPIVSYEAGIEEYSLSIESDQACSENLIVLIEREVITKKKKKKKKKRRRKKSIRRSIYRTY